MAMQINITVYKDLYLSLGLSFDGFFNQNFLII